ncbi:MAG TPA: alpha/beta hydrolase [Acidimicrobiales bacterium]|nr:alpha/beta hydrolase [Acidimicrobiales bacterium]
MEPATRLLLSGAASAALTGVGLRPVDRHGLGSGPAFVLGLPISEMPLHVGAAQAALALLLSRAGGPRGWRGMAGLGLTAASLAGLWRLHRDAQDAERVLEEALVGALGAGYRDRIHEPFSPPPVAPLTRRSMLAPQFFTRKRYVGPGGEDLPYGEAGRRNHLDVWRRPDLPADAAAPVLVEVHGGAWMMGQKRGQAEPLMSHLAERGWVCVTLNYRLSPRATWPDHIVDVKRALTWVKAHIADYGGDPGFVVVTGGSAGGHLAALTALTPGLAAYQPGFEDADTSVAAAVPFYGVYDFTSRGSNANLLMEDLLARNVFKTSLDDDSARWELASPMSHAGSDAPPFFLLHGTNDTLVPVEQARAFADLLGAGSRRPVVYAELPRAQHAFDVLPSVRAHHTVHAVERFLAVVRSEHGGPTPAEAVAPASGAAAQESAGRG